MLGLLFNILSHNLHDAYTEKHQLQDDKGDIPNVTCRHTHKCMLHLQVAVFNLLHFISLTNAGRWDYM